MWARSRRLRRPRLSGKPAWPEGVAARIIDSADSTNALALRLGPSLVQPTWFVALEQTAGRGRRARPWSSPRGNFHGTLALKPEGPVAQVALRSFVAALALRDALAEVAGQGAELSLKWPNDVLLNGGKVAGILLESVSSHQDVAQLAVGIGVNLIASPDPTLVEPGTVRPVNLLAETGRRIAPEAFLDHLAPAYARWEAQLVARGFAPIRAAWLSHAARLGQVIRARTGTQSREGLFETVDETGALILRTKDGAVAIPAAEVFF